jgi:hypothetical protein
MARIALVFGVLVAASVACKPRGSEVHLDPASWLPKLTERMIHVVGEPEVAADVDTLAAAVGADPTLRTRGAALWGAMISDPGTATALSEAMAALQRTPGLKHAIAELVATHPGEHAGRLDALAVQRIVATWSSPPIHEAWMRTWRRLRARLELGARPAVVEAGIATRIGHDLDRNAARWGDRLIELNGGKLPGAERAVELYLDHAWAEDRMRRFLRSLLANPGFHHELIAALHRLLALPVVERELRTAARALLSDATSQRAAVELTSLLLDGAPAPAAVEQQLEQLVLPAPVVAAINHVIATILADPAVPGIVVDAFHHLAADPRLTADLDPLIAGW